MSIFPENCWMHQVGNFWHPDLGEANEREMRRINPHHPYIMFEVDLDSSEETISDEGAAEP